MPGRALLAALTWLAVRTPERWLRGIGACLGWLAYALGVRRRVTLENLQRALGLPRADARRLARRVYGHLGRGALEFLTVGRLDRERASRILEGPGLGRLQQLLAAGRGLLVISAHLGNWDLLACAAARLGIPVNVVTRQIKRTWINRFWMGERAACGVRLLPAQGSAGAIFRALRQGEVVALVLDQHEPGGLPVPFFGRPAATGTAAARLARATGAPVVPAFLPREGAGFQLEVGEVVDLAWTGDRAQDVQRATERLSAEVEVAVRRWPEQWLWLHRRWKTPSRPSAMLAGGFSAPLGESTQAEPR